MDDVKTGELIHLLKEQSHEWCNDYRLRKDNWCYNVSHGNVDFCPGNLGRGCAIAHLLSYFDRERYKGNGTSK